MRISKIDVYCNANINTFQAKKISKPAEKSISKQSLNLLGAAMTAIGMAGIELSSNNKTPAQKPRKKYKRMIDKIDLDFFMQVYNSEGSVNEKSKKLGMSHTTYRNIVDELGLEFIPSKTGLRMSESDIEFFKEIYYSKISMQEKVEKLKKKSPLAVYAQAHRLGIRKRKTSDISEDEFKKVFYMKAKLPEKVKMLGIGISSYYVLANRFGCIKNKNKS